MDLAAIEATLKAAAGRQRVTEDVVSASTVERMAATLESQLPPPRAGEPLPAGWHTVFCLRAPSRRALGPDGLPASFDEIPPLPMQRRMFGGARMTFHAPLLVGEPVRCQSTLTDAKVRSSPTAHMAIVTLRHQYFGPAGLAVTEEQDTLHLEPIPQPAGAAAATSRSAAEVERLAPTWSRRILPDTIMLFRFSALTFNSHRIHYDAPYCAEVEKLPGLMVQGKLVAMHLLETVRAAAPEARPASFQYRSGRQLFATGPFVASAALDAERRAATLWAEDADGRTVQSATMTFSESVRA